MKAPESEQPVPAPQGKARHSVRAAQSETEAPNNNPGAQRTDAPHQSGADELTGLPVLRTWREVYLFVFGSFILWVLLLLALTLSYQ